MHHHNEDLVLGLKDNSGVDIYYTESLRQYDAGTITLHLNGMFGCLVPKVYEEEGSNKYWNSTSGKNWVYCHLSCVT